MIGKRTEEQVKRWYDRWHSLKKENAWRSYDAYPPLLDSLPIPEGKTLLDVGCGTGLLLKAAEERNVRTYGIDISKEGVKIARRISPHSKIILGNAERLPYASGFFDYIFCAGALEHFLSMDRGISEMKRVGKKRAQYCIIVPNKNFLYWQLKRSAGTHQQDISETLYSLQQWKSFFADHGFEITQITQDKWHMTQLRIFSPSNPLSVAKKIMYKLGWFFLPLPLAYQFIFVLKKKKIRVSS